MQLVEVINERSPVTKVIMLTAFTTMETTVEAFRKRVFDFRTKPRQN